MWLHARAEAHAALGSELRVRATTLAGIFEIAPEGPELDLPVDAVREYRSPGSGTYAAVVDTAGRSVIRSPSLGETRLAPAAPWTAGEFVLDEVGDGPDGFPCARMTHSFVARAESAIDGDWTPPPPEALRHQVVVLKDTRPRDARLAELAGFLALTALGACAAAIAGGVVLSRWVLGPIRRMAAEAEALTPEDASRRLHPDGVVAELASLARTLNSALGRLGDALDREKRFASHASHELRTPLAALRASVDLLLRRDRSAPEYRDGLARQRRILERMSRMTESLLVLARADGAGATLDRAPVDVADTVRRVCSELEPLAAEGGVALDCDAADPAPVTGDATYLAALVVNLVSNAVKFTPAKGHVRAAVRREGAETVVEVSDTGRGIAPEHLPHVFERFFRANDGADRREGAGLGLAIADWIARAHGGRIDVRSTVGVGSTFTVRLPCAAADRKGDTAPAGRLPASASDS